MIRAGSRTSCRRALTAAVVVALSGLAGPGGVIAPRTASAQPPADAAAVTQTMSVERVVGLLGGVDTPPSLAHIRALGEPARRGILTLARDRSAVLRLRLRATYALSAFADRATAEALMSLCADTSESVLLRREAVLALDRSGAAGVVPALIHALDDTSPDVREAAARCLRRRGTQETEAALRRRARHERSPRVLSAMGRGSSR